MFKIILWVFLCLLFVRIDGFKVTILHYNDLEGQLRSFKTGTDPPSECMGEGTTPDCSGGLARIAKVIEEEIQKDPNNTIKVQSGNFVGGYWMSALHQSWISFGQLLNTMHNASFPDSTALVPHIYTLGFKEFEAGLTQTKDFMLNVNHTMPLLTNVDCPGQTADFCNHVISSKEVVVSGTFGIPFVGFMNPTVQKLSEPGALAFPDIVTSLESKILLQFGSEKHVIAVGQGSISIAKEIIDRIPQVKVVILSGGINDPNDEEYPFNYNEGVIVKAQKYGESIGKLTFEYHFGKMSNFDGDLIPIDTKVTGSDALVQAKISELYNADILPLTKDIIGHTAVEIQWDKGCWKKECNLGNLVTDAMVRCAYNSTEKDPKNLPFGIIAFWHSGAIHNDIQHFQVSITALEPHIWFPFHNRPVYVRISGEKLWKIFERSATGLGSQANPDWGQFLQVSREIRVTYRQTEDNRFVLDDLRVFGKESAEAKVPTFINVKDNPDHEFEAIIPSFIFNGRSVYNDIFLDTDKLPLNATIYDDQCVESYIRAEYILRNGFEERIFIGDNSSSKCKGSNTAVTVTLTLLIFIFICGIAFLGFRFGYQGWYQRRNHQQF